MIYNYNAVSGLLSSITYTGNSAANINPYNQIIFTYAARSDSNISYPGYSVKLADKWLLTEIDVKNEDTIVKNYQFVYDDETTFNVYSLLSEIIESDRSRNQLNSTKIIWNDKITDSSSNIQVEDNPKRLFANTDCGYILRWIDRVYHGFGYYETVDRSVLSKASDIALSMAISMGTAIWILWNSCQMKIIPIPELIGVFFFSTVQFIIFLQHLMLAAQYQM